MSEEGGGDFDPCECLRGHQMQVLLNVLRQSQAYCTDNECFTHGPNPRESGPDHVLLITVFFIVALFLYYFRPNRQQTIGASKPSNTDNGTPPNPPPAIN